MDKSGGESGAQDERARQRQRDALRMAWESARPAWIALADAAWQLDGIASRIGPALERGGEAETLRTLQVMARRLREQIAEGEVECLIPTGEAYTPELANLLESIAQRPVCSLRVPTVLEVVEPAILLRGTLIRGGKVITGIPTLADDTQSKAAAEGASEDHADDRD